ncbi:MurR/RpiR family transcriptional regulator [Epibacterium ulvae]|uniref:Transcriptional regulator, RpiR family n=1 Tax=Epibacterium ulvae TaxID=1156985 RepID=A0A1G5QFK5_9RHOB|nr:MurR/RpiR family transcriptional regulator [Epibacterium ulvae]SCZ60376.1 transcriptional regulator, RpiR family [Epibacterium ulvae]
MNDSNVWKTKNSTAEKLLDQLQSDIKNLTPELRKFAGYLLDNPNEICISSIRKVAKNAQVKPNTPVRLSQHLGLTSYDAFREIFREDIRKSAASYPDRAKWLQSLSDRDEMDFLYAASAENALQNIETFFTETDHLAMQEAAKDIVAARRVYALGVGVNNAIVQNFAYLANMAVDGIRALPSGGSLPVDALTRADENDLLIATSFHPYRREVSEAISAALQKGLKVISISDRPSSPLLSGAAHKFVVPTSTPQFFVSTLALTAFFEVLVGFIIAEAGEDVVNSIQEYHAQRRALGVYIED